MEQKTEQKTEEQIERQVRKEDRIPQNKHLKWIIENPKAVFELLKDLNDNLRTAHHDVTQEDRRLLIRLDGTLNMIMHTGDFNEMADFDSDKSNMMFKPETPRHEIL